jgi:hypothetical protein
MYFLAVEEKAARVYNQRTGRAVEGHKLEAKMFNTSNSLVIILSGCL